MNKNRSRLAGPAGEESPIRAMKNIVLYIFFAQAIFIGVGMAVI